MSGLLMALSDPPENRVEDFECWYDAHAPARLTIPGITSAQCYDCVEGGPAHMAYYDLDSPDVLSLPEYRQLRESRPPGESEMLAELPTPIDRRVYRRIAPDAVTPEYSAGASMYALGVWMSVGDEDDCHAWYDEEHVPLLLKVDGWMRIRRFELVEGAGPKFLAMHDLASLDVMDDPIRAAARDTPWRDRVVADRTRYERRVFRLRRRY